MSTQTFSRSYLKSLPEERKKKEIDMIIDAGIISIKNAASIGETTYWISLDYMIESGGNIRVRNHGSSPIDISISDLMVGYKERFPDCKISYHEDLEGGIISGGSLRRRILLDWT